MKKQYYWLVKDCESHSLCEIKRFDTYKEACLEGEKEYNHLTPKERSITALYIDKAPLGDDISYYNEAYAKPKKTYIDYVYRKWGD